MTSRHLRSIIVAVVALFVVAGTAFAAHPGGIPRLADPGASGSPSASQAVHPMRSDRPKAVSSAKPKASDEADSSGAPAAAEIDRVVAQLKAAGINTTAAQVAQLASKVGLGGAVRVLVFAKASGKTPAEILAMFESGKGWGVIAKELKLEIGPGIGGIMSRGQAKDHGNGHGNGNGNPSGTDD